MAPGLTVSATLGGSLAINNNRFERFTISKPPALPEVMNDLATAILMERFYENLLTHKLRRDEALRDAQRYTCDITVGQLKSGGWLTEEIIERLAGGTEKVREELQHLAQQPDDHRPFEHPTTGARSSARASRGRCLMGSSQ